MKNNKKKNTEFYFELVLFLVLGFLVGITIKNEAVKKITIGFNDYKMKIDKQDYNINQAQKDLDQKQKQEQEQAEQKKKLSQEAEKKNNSAKPAPQIKKDTKK